MKQSQLTVLKLILHLLEEICMIYCSLPPVACEILLKEAGIPSGDALCGGHWLQKLGSVALLEDSLYQQSTEKSLKVQGLVLSCHSLMVDLGLVTFNSKPFKVSELHHQLLQRLSWLMGAASLRTARQWGEKLFPWLTGPSS